MAGREKMPRSRRKWGKPRALNQATAEPSLIRDCVYGIIDASKDLREHRVSLSPSVENFGPDPQMAQRRSYDEILDEMAQGKFRGVAIFIHNLVSGYGMILEKYPCTLPDIEEHFRNTPALLDDIKNGPRSDVIPQTDQPLFSSDGELKLAVTGRRSIKRRVLPVRRKASITPRGAGVSRPGGKTGKTMQDSTSLGLQVAGDDRDERGYSADSAPSVHISKHSQGSPIDQLIPPAKPLGETSDEAAKQRPQSIIPVSTTTEASSAISSGPQGTISSPPANTQVVPQPVHYISGIPNVGAPGNRTPQDGPMVNCTPFPGVLQPNVTSDGYSSHITWPSVGQIPPQFPSPYYVPVPPGQPPNSGWMGAMRPHLPSYAPQAVSGSGGLDLNTQVPPAPPSQQWNHGLANGQMPPQHAFTPVPQVTSAKGIQSEGKQISGLSIFAEENCFPDDTLSDPRILNDLSDPAR